jgi:hypothetical protein
MSLSGHMFKKYFFVDQIRFSKAERKKILIPQISCDPFKIFHDPLPGRDPSVEKRWPRLLNTKKLGNFNN